MLVQSNWRCVNCKHPIKVTFISEGYYDDTFYEAEVVYGKDAGKTKGVRRCPKCGTDIENGSLERIDK